MTAPHWATHLHEAQRGKKVGAELWERGPWLVALGLPTGLSLQHVRPRAPSLKGAGHWSQKRLNKPLLRQMREDQTSRGSGSSRHIITFPRIPSRFLGGMF